MVHHGDTGLRAPSVHQSLKFVGLSVRNIWHTSSLSISRPGDANFWPWKWCALLHVMRTTFPPILVFLTSSTYRPTHVRRVTWPYDLYLWPWSSRCLSMMLVFVPRLYTKFEVRRPSCSDDIGHLMWALIDLVTLTFDLLTSRVTHGMTFHPIKFGLPRP